MFQEILRILVGDKQKKRTLHRVPEMGTKRKAINKVIHKVTANVNMKSK